MAARPQELRTLCDRYGVRFHMDGARLWEARPALGVPYAEVGVDPPLRRCSHAAAGV
jgi:threonine aldolase